MRKKERFRKREKDIYREINKSIKLNFCTLAFTKIYISTLIYLSYVLFFYIGEGDKLREISEREINKTIFILTFNSISYYDHFSN